MEDDADDDDKKFMVSIAGALSAIVLLCMCTYEGLFKVTVGVTMYAVFALLSYIVALDFDMLFCGKRPLSVKEGHGSAFIYGPGIAVMLQVLLIPLLLLDKAGYVSGWWSWIWLLLVAALAILALVVIMPLLTLLIPVALILGLFSSWALAIVTAGCLLGMWSLVSLFALLKRLIADWLAEEGAEAATTQG